MKASIERSYRKTHHNLFTTGKKVDVFHNNVQACPLFKSSEMWDPYNYMFITCCLRNRYCLCDGDTRSPICRHIKSTKRYVHTFMIMIFGDESDKIGRDLLFHTRMILIFVCSGLYVYQMIQKVMPSPWYCERAETCEELRALIRGSKTSSSSHC